MIKVARKYDLPVLVLVVSGFFIALKIHQYLSYGIGGELADFELVLWNTLRGRFLEMKCSSLSFFSEHFSPILLFILPIYALVQSPFTLLIIHSVAAGFAVIPLYYIAEHLTSLRWVPFAICIAYFLSRVLNYGLMYDFHPEIFYPLFFLSAYLAFLKVRWRWYYLFILLGACVKEDAAIVIIGFGLFLYFSGYKKHGAITAAGGLIWLIIAVGVIIPVFRGGNGGENYQFLKYWSGYGAAKEEIALNMLNPLYHFRVIFASMKLKQMFNLFSVFAFLPFVSGRALLFLVVPNWFILYSSDNGLMNGPIIYYGLLITPFLFISALTGINVIANKWSQHKYKIWSISASAILLIHTGNSRLFNQLSGESWRIEPRYSTVSSIIGMIPPNASVSAQIYLVSHLPPRPGRTYFPDNIQNTQYVLLDRQGYTWPFEAGEYEKYTDKLLKSPQWEIIEEKNGFVLLRRCE